MIIFIWLQTANATITDCIKRDCDHPFKQHNRRSDNHRQSLSVIFCTKNKKQNEKEKVMNEELLLESKDLRDKNVEHYEVLENVKGLLLISGTELATVQQVADFYEVGKEAIEAIYTRNRDELTEDGMKLSSYKDFLNLQHESLETSIGKTIITFSDGDSLSVPNRGLRVFPRRAILRVGMLLRDSKVAREVRTQLLNIEEKTALEVKTADIEEEQRLMLNVGMAYASGDPNAIMVAATEMMRFKNRHIEKLESTNKALTNGILEWEDRSRLNFAVRKLARFTGIYYSKMWNELYKQLKNSYHIDLKARGKQPWISHIEEDEWQIVIKCFSALCQYYEYEPEDMFCDLEVK